ncbi:MAG: hypothetical protein JO193_06395 [Candidatus Eremiobacteraeota bacterium]|nr:hypothetical protein [Candidatus Eremiobacteraeota bacterium]MBV9971711.1 hypothetical protein [Candidatus Eremiobacteraeota bacterium]
MFLRPLIATLATFAITSSLATAKPTPVPGGANQVGAISGQVGQAIFNGVLRINVQDVREATPEDHPEQMLPQPSQKVMVMDVLLRNGSHSNFIDLISYTLADKDDVAFNIPSNYIRPANLNIQQGASARQKAMFLVDKDYQPTKLLVQCATCGTKTAFRAVRLSLSH